jgi:hypothetical protein
VSGLSGLALQAAARGQLWKTLPSGTSSCLAIARQVSPSPRKRMMLSRGTVAGRPSLTLIFYSFGAILTRFTLLEFAKIENVVQLLKGECIFVLIRKYCALRGVESTSARDVFPSQAR